MISEKLTDRHLEESLAALTAVSSLSPRVAVVLGSGLGEFAEQSWRQAEIPTSGIPHFPVSSVAGHKAKVVFGRIEGVPLVAFQGRVHYYEYGSGSAAVYPIQIAARLGAKVLMVTNAAGAVEARLATGDFMAIADQLNLTGKRPGAGAQGIKLEKFVYDRELLTILEESARKCGIPLRKGVYAGMQGPSYESPAEVEMVRRLGGDAVGMSTVLEAECGTSLGMRVAGLSCITNQATKLGGQKLDHQEVLETTELAKKNFAVLLTTFVASLAAVA